MALQIRDFLPSGADLAIACQIWNRAVAPESELYLEMTADLLAERLVGPEGEVADICLLAESDGELVGLAVGTTRSLVEPDVANLACLAVMPGARGGGIGAGLLAEVEKRACTAGCTQLKVDYATRIRLAHGVDPVTAGHLWLLRRGFTVSRDQLFMRLAFATWQMPAGVRGLLEELRAAGLDLRMASESDLPALLETAGAFGDSIVGALRNDVSKPGGDPVLIAAEGEKVFGFVGPLKVSGCGFADFELIAVAEPQRGRGIGKALFHLALSNFQERGAQMFELMTGPTNPAQKLYLDAGMRLVTVLVCHEKDLSR